MRKIAAIIILCIMLLTHIPVYASGIDVMLSASYAMWADFYNIPGFYADFESMTINDDLSVMECDALLLYYNHSTFDVENAFLLYRLANADDTEMDLRALALFAAVEYGLPIDLSPEDYLDAMNLARGILTELKNTLSKKADLIEDHRPVVFYIGENAEFSLFKNSNGTITIIIIY